MVITLNTLVLAAVLSVGSALIGAVVALLGVWVWYTVRLVDRIERRGNLYLADFDNERGKQLKAAYDLATAIEYMRQTLRTLSPEMAREFTREEPKKAGKP